jgi:hypothetical protein
LENFNDYLSFLPVSSIKSPDMRNKQPTDPCNQHRFEVAQELENEVNETLASVLLWMEHAWKENNLPVSNSLVQAETNLKAAIDHVRLLHLSLRNNVTE